MAEKNKNQKKAAHVKYGINLKSIQFKTWVNFFLMAAIVLVSLWIIQILFFKTYFESMREKEIEDMGDEIAQQYPGVSDSPKFAEFIRKLAFDRRLNIIVFNMTCDSGGAEIKDVCFKVEYLSSSFNAENLPGEGLINTTDPRIIEEWDTFLPKILSSSRFIYQETSERGAYLIYGAALPNDNYLYVSSPLILMDSTAMVLKNQLLIVTVICLLLSLVLSWFISSRISKPITEFSLAAQKLAKGDYSVKFVGNGYTEIEDLAQTLNYATEEMGKTEALRRDFLANVSHDLRTPLTMVKAYAEMIRDISGADGIKRTEHSQVIIDEADRLTNLVNDILNLSKLQSGTDELSPSPTDLSFLAKAVVERFDIYSSRSSYVFKTSLEENCIVMADSKKLEQVLYNLISNAVNYTGADKTVRIYVKKIDGMVAVAICDSGKGIPEEEIDTVWERYYRASTRKREVVGNGLGLSIVKNILLAHKAEFGVKSRLNEGSAFYFKLPLAILQEEPEEISDGKKIKAPKKSRKANIDQNKNGSL